MKKINIIFIGTFISLIVAVISTSADEGKSSGLKSKLNPLKKNSINQEEVCQLPDWLKRTSIAVDVASDEEPTYFLETIQPLLGTQDKDIVLFNQTRVSTKDTRPTYNIGFGARKIFSDTYLLGGNAFYDYQDLHKHSRGGFGLEGISDRGLEARLNTYAAISGEHLVKEDANEFEYEEVANGFDWELGSPLPYLNFLKVYGGGYWYNFQHFKNKYGWQMRTEYNPIKGSRVVFRMFDDTKRSKVGYGFEGALSFKFTSFCPKDIITDIKGSKEAYPKINLHEKVLDRVVRDFDITVIKKTKTKGGLVIEGGKT